MKSLQDKLKDGDYNNKVEFPSSAMRKSNPDVYKELKRQYYIETTNLEDQFRMDLEDDCGTSNHPLKDTMYSMAWEFGHSSGYSEVHSYYTDLMGFVVSMNKYIKETFGIDLSKGK
jgi:hypothetical protein